MKLQDWHYQGQVRSPVRSRQIVELVPEQAASWGGPWGAEDPVKGLQCLQSCSRGAQGCLGEGRQMREPSLIKSPPMSECEANKAAPLQGTSTPSQPVCLFIARMEIINASWHWGHYWGQSLSPFCKTRGNELPSTCGSGLLGRGQ